MPVFSKPAVKEEDEKVPTITSIKMPLPRSIAGSGDSRNQTYRRSGVSFKGPDQEQCMVMENLQVCLTQLAFCDCCSKAKFNSLTKKCDGINCLLGSFQTTSGEFDYAEAKKCFMHYYNIHVNLDLEKWKIWCYILQI